MAPLFLLYINDLPKVIQSKATPILFADATSTLITSPNSSELKNDINIVFKQINIWFEANLLSLNLDKTHFIQLQIKVHRQLIFTLDMMTSKFKIPLTERFLDCLLMIHCPGKHI